MYFLSYLLHGQSPSCENNRFSASQEIPRILWNPKLHYHIRKCPPPAPILSQFDPVHAAHIPLPEYPSLCYPPIYAWFFQLVSFPQVSPPKSCVRLSSTCTLYPCRHAGLCLVACSRYCVYMCVCVCVYQQHFYALVCVSHIEWIILCTRNSKRTDLLLRKQKKQSNKRHREMCYF
jgi:hypothetical protein